MIASAPCLTSLQTPALILDERKMQRNIGRLADHLSPKGVTLRPHLKTVKSTEIARRLLTGGFGPATVSTLAEAEVFAGMGVRDITYAVGITPQKLDRVAAIRAGGCDLTVILDSVEQASAVVEACQRLGQTIPALIELDCDGHRSGVCAGDPVLIEIGNILHKGAELRGVLTHAGESYEVYGKPAHTKFAEQERSAAVRAAEMLRSAGLPCPVVSIGSTPTAHAIENTEGITEVRAGVYAFFDLVQAGIGVCDVDDIALSVLTTVIGHQREKGWIITDAGWMALSQDRGTASQKVDQGYGVVCDQAGNVMTDLIVIKTNQEHGIIACRTDSKAALPDLPLGTLLRILPNHACAVAAQYSAYHVIPSEPAAPVKVWPRFGGW
ncbi:DSD1 family PLP-dependent enzyme [Hoeflea sp. YIM 152468]|uniref:DSD1 family PLP-dependent enzyme n=1 Tax=Hoeflea sp. YIM 152468 TaxID=3031759 RepID=UPI0023DC2F98|nr:DSD1 family PLP-dependent enzyme [Hoeflea sp. YIM 152468]MDF1608882.1 DSD1 family PLP-dependent enzyme [Hoeflea sp. YIM 152468]